jgi:putative tricarboxylic transport membrane protein
MNELAAMFGAVVASPMIIPAAFGGIAWGILGGALPGISPSITMALLLPFTYGADPTAAVVLLASTYLGAEYGGSIPAILIRTPGTNSAAATVIDGYAMKEQGRAGEALGISLYSTVLGSTFGVILLVTLTQPLANLALAFQPTSYVGLGVLGLSVIASLAGESLIKGMMAGFFGLMIATVGTDPVTGNNRFTFDDPELLSGIPPILVMVGIYAIAELFEQASQPGWRQTAASDARITLPDALMRARLRLSQVIGAVIGFIEGLTPGAGGTIAAFMSYNEARRWSKKPEEFGHGSPEGIAAPETANGAVSATALIPMLGLGIPGSNSAAVLLGGFLIHGMTPGPMLFTKHHDVVMGLYAGKVISLFALLIVAYLILRPCIWLVNRPKHYLMAFIFALVLSGVYAINNSLFHVGVALAFGVIGYGMKYFQIPTLPMVLGVVLGFMVESNYRRALVLSDGDLMTFAQDPISAALLALAAIFIIVSLVRHFRESGKPKAESKAA